LSRGFPDFAKPVGLLGGGRGFGVIASVGGLFAVGNLPGTWGQGLGLAVCLWAGGLGSGVSASPGGLFAVGNLPGAWGKACGVGRLPLGWRPFVWGIGFTISAGERL